MLKSNMALVGLTAIALMSGCNRAATNNNAGSTNSSSSNAAAAAPAPAPAPAAAPAASGAPVDEAFLTAHPWAMPGMCGKPTIFHADGRLTDDIGPGTWGLSGTTLMISQGNRASPMTASRSGEDLVLTEESMSITMKPCPAGSGGEEKGADGEGGE